MISVLIGITTAESVHHEVLEALFNMKRPNNVRVDLKIIHAYQVSTGRNELAIYALSNHYDYLFFVDSDVVIPDYTLERLLQANVLVINGTYPRKEIGTITSKTPFTTLYKHDSRGLNKINFSPYFMNISELPESGIVPVDAAGLGCTLIHCSVFNILDYNNWFHFCEEQPQINHGPYCLGEDLYFYRECLRHDIQPYAEGSVRCEHIGKITYSFPKS